MVRIVPPEQIVQRYPFINQCTSQRPGARAAHLAAPLKKFARTLTGNKQNLIENFKKVEKPTRL